MKTMTTAKMSRGPGAISLAAVMVLLVAISLMWACGSDTPTGPPERDRSDDDGEFEIDMDDIDGFEEGEEYSRPDYRVRRNPFRPDSDVLAFEEEDDDDDSIRRTEPLEQYTLSSLDLVTIISETTVPRAMFIDPSGLGHFAKEGDRIGQNDGVIRSIRSNEVEIDEGGGAGEGGSSVTVAMTETDLRSGSRDELSEEELERYRELMGTEEGREALEQMAGSDDGSTDEAADDDDRFPGLRPPE